MAGVAPSHIHLGFAWQAWHSWHWVARLGWFWSRVTPQHFAWQAWHNLTSTLVLRGRRSTISHPPSFCAAGVAQSHTHLRFAWQAWHLWHWLARLGWFWSPVMPRHFAWQAWHKMTSTLVSRGMRGTISHPPSFCVAVVAQSHIHLRFAWQSWHLCGTLCGRRGTISHPPSFCVAGVAQSHIHLRFLHGRRGTISHPLSFCVAGVALMALGGALGSVLVADDAAALCVAGVALGDIYLRYIHIYRQTYIHT